MLTIASSDANASFICSASGHDSTGLPATVNIILSCPSPGSRISTGRSAAGSSPWISGLPLTRLSQRPVRYGRPCFSGRTRSITERGNIAPPGSSRLPVRIAITSISQVVSVPNSTVVVPIRPCTAAVGASAISSARRSIVAASMPVTSSAYSGENGSIASRSRPMPSTRPATRPIETLSVPIRRWTIAASNAASVPGRMAMCSSAASAVRVRLGSMTTTLPPRSRTAWMRPG